MKQCHEKPTKRRRVRRDSLKTVPPIESGQEDVRERKEQLGLPHERATKTNMHACTHG